MENNENKQITQRASVPHFLRQFGYLFTVQVTFITVAVILTGCTRTRFSPQFKILNMETQQQAQETKTDEAAYKRITSGEKPAWRESLG